MEPLLHGELTRKIIGAAIDTHRALGPGLLESVYEEELCARLRRGGMCFNRQVPIVRRFSRGLRVALQLDIVVEDAVIVEVMSVSVLVPVHTVKSRVILSHLESGILSQVESGYQSHPESGYQSHPESGYQSHPESGYQSHP